MRVSTVAVCLLVGCSGGDLTLPDSADPVSLRIVSGDGQRADAGDLLAQPLVVQVLDSDANPVPDARVEFGFLGGPFDDLGVDHPTGEHLILARVVGTASPELSARFAVVATSSGGGGKKDDEGKGHNGGHDDDD